MRLSSSGKRRLVRDFSFFKLAQKRWDGLWRIVFYDIPELEKKTRVALRQKLRELGFGQLQESVFISPFDLAEDVREFILTHNLGDQVFVSVSRRLLAGNEKALAEKIWDLAKLNERYQEWFESERSYSSYLEILKDDPCLPKELLPEDWVGEKARKEAKRLLTNLFK